MKKALIKILRAILCKKTVSGIMTIGGALFLAVSGTEWAPGENVIEMVVTASAILLVTLGYEIALHEPTEEEKDDREPKQDS